MNSELLIFFLFSSFAIASSIMVIASSNAVHSVLFLILVFCNIAGILLLIGAEFLAFLLLIVYVGAIAVLFLFVVMMLNIKSTSFKNSNWSTVPLGFLIFMSLITQFIALIDLNFVTPQSSISILHWTNWILENQKLSNIGIIGKILYTSYSFVFLIAGFLLLIAMIGAIVLTMHQRSNIKKQIIELQLTRNSYGTVKFVKLRK